MITMHCDVDWAENEDDVAYQEYLLLSRGAKILDTEIEMKDKEVVSATITIEVFEEDKQKFLDYGCY